MQVLHLSHDYHAKALCKLGTSAVGVVPLMHAIKIADLCLSAPLLVGSSLKALVESL